MTHIGTSEISALLVYTRALHNTKNWSGSFPMASVRRLEQTLQAHRPLDFSDIQAAASIFQYALSGRTPLAQEHKDFLIELAAKAFPNMISESRLKMGTLVLTPAMRINRDAGTHPTPHCQIPVSNTASVPLDTLAENQK